MAKMNGSIWRKWDLHIHTPDSVLANNFDGSDTSDKWLKYISEIEKTDIQVLGVTNYFCNEGYAQIKDFKSKGKLPGIDLIIPNVEFRLSEKNKDNEFINIHVLFSDKVDGTRIDKFLTRLPLLNTSGENLGKFCDIDTLRKVGFEQALIGLSDLRTNLKYEFNEKNEFIVASNCRGYGSFRPGKTTGRGTAYAIEIDKFSDIIFGRDEDVDFFIDRSRFKGAESKPVLKGSDAHSLDEIGRGYTWIKANPTFEGLRQTIFEPELRVSIQEENPTEAETYLKTNKVIFNLPNKITIRDDDGGESDFCINKRYEFGFSNNLTCFTGGRGSGKSTIIHAMFNAIFDSNEDASRLREINSPLINLELEPSPLSKLRELTDIRMPANTEFFFQNELEKHAKNIESMSKLITQRFNILSQIDPGDSLYDLRSNWENSNINFGDIISSFDSILNFNSRINEIGNRKSLMVIQTETIQHIDYQKIKDAIFSLTGKITEFSEMRFQYETIINKIYELLDEVSEFTWPEKLGKEELSAFTKDLIKHKNLLADKFIEIEIEYNKNKYSEQLESQKDEMKVYLKNKGLAPENIEELTDATEEIKRLESKINTLKREREPFEKSFVKKDSNMNIYKNNYEKYKTRNQELALVLVKILSGLSASYKEISFDIRTDDEQVKNNVTKFIRSYCSEGTREDNIKNVVFDKANLSELIKGKEEILKQIKSSTRAEETRKQLLELTSDQDFLEQIHMQLIRNYYDIANIKVQTMLGEKPIQNTSFGERCGIVIAIIIGAGNSPIIIDQPEDNLDGKFISEVLVPLIRRQKKRRQIIFVTRDANIVIGSDSELINLLESNGDRTVVIPSTIEDVETRPNYIWILDGGEEAFRKREQKYGLDKSN